MQLARIPLLVGAFVVGAAFSSESAGRICVQNQGERGVAYDIHKTKMTDAYDANGRRLIEDGHRYYEVEVPPLVRRSKQDKPLSCLLRLDNGMWRLQQPSPATIRDARARERRERDYR